MSRTFLTTRGSSLIFRPVCRNTVVSLHGEQVPVLQDSSWNQIRYLPTFWAPQFLVAFLLRKPKIESLLASMKSVNYCKNSTSNPLPKACSGFPIAACDSRSCSESRPWSWKFSWKAANHDKSTKENRQMRDTESWYKERHGKPVQKFWCSFQNFIQNQEVFSKKQAGRFLQYIHKL